MCDTHSCKSGKPSASFKQVLVAVDDSQQSTWALQMAIQFASGTGAELNIVHVYAAPFVSPELPLDVNALEASAKARGEATLNEQCARVPSDLICNKILREGYAVDHVIEVARELQADLIIVGTHGRGRLASFILGSTAEAIIRRAPCPVLSVAHEPATTGATAHAELIASVAGH